ncbi:hypothetical protein JHK82_027810 [Glycine max]|nr:hypothetical protein JHK85_028464 [Glycine max]KAG5003810.1 hypothetical protein JHK86_027949 [Glycine max]KAG5126975.1 hypothetical protein JHK82_027810 [Glycine max]KAG5151591.1 hypothetical protein JHK84_028063 [Glycine max]
MEERREIEEGSVYAMVYSSSVVLDSRSSVWKGIWHAEAPVTCRSLAWRACRDELPVRSLLVQSGLVDNALCPICGRLPETVTHALLLCDDAKLVWFASPLGLRVESLRGVSTLSQWIDQYCVDTLDDEAMGVVCATMWALWHRRNAWVFHSKGMDCMQVLAKASSMFVVVPDGPDAWVLPSSPYVKVNFAAAVKDNVGTAMGMIFRDSFGTTRASGTNFLEDECFEPQIAEALCYKWALEQSGDLGFSEIIFETDCQKLYIQWNQLKQGKASDDSYLHSLLEECIMMIQGTGSSLRLVRPTANKVAQCLADVAFDYGEKVWMGVVPEEVSSHLQSDMANAKLP